MSRRVSVLALLAMLLSSLGPAAVAADTTLPLPASMAAVGDSITQAASTAGTLGADYPNNSWSTGPLVAIYADRCARSPSAARFPSSIASPDA